MKRKIKTIKTGAWERGFSLAKLTLKAGTKTAAYTLGGLFSSESSREVRKNSHLAEQMQMLAGEFGLLKGSLMKVGQMFSVLGEHFLPPEANRFLKSLQFESPPLEWETVEKQLKKQLGSEALAKLEVDEEPLAAASMGQVHRARIKTTGEDIVLKIQYPGVEGAIDGDLKVLRRLLSMAELLPNLPDTDEIFAEVRSMLHQELDYEQEAKQLEHYREAFKEDPRYVIPRSFKEFSSKRVLAMSYEPGLPIDSSKVTHLSQKRRNAIATAVLEFYFRELFELHAVQTDPHFGNYRIRPETDQVVLYDFGAVRKFSKRFLTDYRAFVRAMFYQDRQGFLLAARALGLLAEGDSSELEQDFWNLATLIIEPFLTETYAWNTDLPKRVSKQTTAMALKHKLRSPPRELVFLDRKLVGMFTFLSVLSAEIPSRKILEPYLK